VEEEEEDACEARHTCLPARTYVHAGPAGDTLELG
jgi:hypothetical protein